MPKTNETATVTPAATSDSMSKEKAKKTPTTFKDMLETFKTTKPELKESCDTSSQEQFRVEINMPQDFERNKQENLNSFFYELAVVPSPACQNHWKIQILKRHLSF